MEQPFDGKPCDDCGVRAANIHLTQISNDETTVFHLCEDCARKRGIAISIDENAMQEQNKAVVEQDNRRCPRCGTTFGEFREKGWLGCVECYGAFSDEIDSLLVQVHGTTVHKGRRPSSAVSTRKPRSANELRVQLEKAIKNEEFEQAAQLRDQIRSIEQT